ncbi:MAG: DUF1223 domain-containing protein [Ferruginibacter sp.]|nr:DUF1223 domain-containing protein [Ferruginibacter sp.]
MTNQSSIPYRYLCCSCPAADGLPGKYAAKNNAQLITQAFHVDYWNRLRWVDSFSSARYRDRQREYASLTKESFFYTLHLIINGTRGFAGSNKAKIETALENALKEKSALPVSIDQVHTTCNFFSINYHPDHLYKNTSLHAALAQKQVYTF